MKVFQRILDPVFFFDLRDSIIIMNTRVYCFGVFTCYFIIWSRVLFRLRFLCLFYARVSVYSYTVSNTIHFHTTFGNDKNDKMFRNFSWGGGGG